MRICAYEVRDDERSCFQEMEEAFGVEICLYTQVPEPKHADLARGCQAVTVLGQGMIGDRLLDRWKEAGVRYLSTRTAGVDHIDMEYARKIGIQVCSASYPPSGVAEFTLMLMLMCLRKYKQALWRGQVNDFSLDGLMGRELREMTVGVVGAGRIGRYVIRLLSSFGCRVLAYSRSRREDLAGCGEYADLDLLYRQSDLITLHLPLTEQTYHMINETSLKKMKDGVVIVNCARGELADSDALIAGIESGKIGALGLDVVEDERGITHVDHRVDILSNQKMAYLRQFPNVVMTPHMAFYTETAVKSMVRCGVQGIIDMAEDLGGAP